MNNPIQFSSSKIVTGVLIGILSLVVVLGVFELGVMVGYNKAHFAETWNRQYNDLFPTPRPGRGPMMPRPGMFDAHGAVGLIQSIQDQTFVIDNDGNEEKTVSLSHDTQVRRGPETIDASKLMVGDRVVVFGRADDQGRIAAKLVRVFDHPMTATSTNQ